MSVELGILLTISSLIVGILGYQLNKQKHQTKQQESLKNDASRDAVIETKLDNISNGVDNIRIDLRTNEKEVNKISQRVTRLEESSKQAHKRIDSLDPNKKIGGM